MDPRERGVAHVNIFWCLVPLVLMLGAAGYGYMKHVEADEAVAAKSEAVQKEAKATAILKHRNEQLKDLTATLGNADKYKDPIVAIEGYNPPADYTTPDAIKRVFDTLKGKLGISSSFNTLDEVVNAAAIELQAKKTEAETLAKQLGDARVALAAAESATDSVRTDLQSQISTKEASIQSAQAKLDAQVRSGAEQVAEAQKKTRTAIEEKEGVIAASNKVIAEKDNQIMNRNAALENAQSKLKLINSPSEPDGRVISSSSTTRLAWIDIGGRDMVKAGMNFRIMESVKGGYRVKGHGIVNRVERDRAQIRVTDLVSSYNPVVKNDVVANDLYSPSLKRNIFLIGRFVAPLSKPEIKRILEDMGNKVYDTMTPEVDLVIVGRQPLGEDATKIEETEDFLKATRWNVEIEALNKIRDFLRL